MSTRISRSATFTLPGLNPVSVPTQLMWDSADPLAIMLRFPRTRDGEVVWMVSRAGVIDALATSDVSGVGEGDVRWYPVDAESLLLELCPPSGHAVLRVPRDVLVDFIADSASEELDCPADPLGWIPDPDDPAWFIDPAWGDAT